MKRGFHPFSNLSIRYKLFASYIFVILIPFLLLLFIHTNMTQRENEDAAVFASHKVLDETKSYLEYKSQAIKEVLNFIAFDDLVQAGVGADSTPYHDIKAWHMEDLQLSKLINQFRYNEDIDSIQIYMRKGLAGATENADFLNMGRIEGEDWYRNFASSNATFAWLPSSVVDGTLNNPELTILRKVPNEHDIQKFDGIVRGHINAAAMQSVLNHAILTPNGAAFLFNDSGDLLSRSDRFPFPASITKAIRDASLRANAEDNYNDDDYKVGGKRHLLGVQAIPNTDMKVALLVPYTDILQSSLKARDRIVSIFLLIVPFMLPLSFFVAASATKRIRLLTSNVRKVKHGQFQMTPLPANEDEIGELTYNFNTMVQNMSGLIDETYSLGREVKNKELKALQAQINPHFLYNTLELINVMAIESDSRDIKRVVDELAIFYKLSLSNGKEYVTLENELRHIGAYVRIQNMRYEDRIRLELEVASELYSCELPKILLQPLVENAIFHGIMEKESEEGTIRIAAWTDKGDVVIEVSDDGIGMDAERLSAIFAWKNGRSDGGSYGVRNIEERLQLSYGSMYGIRFVSTPGIGTRATLRVPDRRVEGDLHDENIR